jgi:non-ribosomal peptide synthetase component F/acyl carrier protein
MIWSNWHKNYEVSPRLKARLQLVQGQIDGVLIAAPPGPIRILSICAGDGRDLLGLRPDHSRRPDIVAYLVDNDSPSLERGRREAAQIQFPGQLHFLEADATQNRSYQDLGHFDLVLISGLLGHLRPEGVTSLLTGLPMLCRHNGWVLWNRHLVLNQGSRQVPTIRQCLAETGFSEIHFQMTDPQGFAVSLAQFRGTSQPLPPEGTLFEFVGLTRLLSSELSTAQPGPSATEPAEAGPAENKNTDSMENLSIPQRFEQILQTCRHRPALAAGSWTADYHTLDLYANRLAQTLLRESEISGERVILLLSHDGPLCAAVWGVLKAGKVAVVLNAGDPPEHLASTARDADAAFILTETAHAAIASALGAAGLILQVEDLLGSGPADDPALTISPDAPAFLIYTSGSSGQPKAVVQTHRNMVHNAHRLGQGLRLQKEDRVSLLASLSGGQGLGTLCVTWLHGAALCPFPLVDKGLTALSNWMTDHQITVYISAASVFRHFMALLSPAFVFSKIRLVRLASEPATSADFDLFLRHFSSSCLLLHTLSSSETGNLTQLLLRTQDRPTSGLLPLGEAADGLEILLWDENDQAVTADETGEIIVRSRYLSPGYWRNPDLTRQCFHADSDGRRFFRSGDLARRDPEGRLIYMGRGDSRVKIRGHRIELSQVEAALQREPSIETSVVEVWKRARQEPCLVAYVVFRSGQAQPIPELRHRLQAVLPRHMMPTGLVALDRLPLHPHGKIDRARLRQIDPFAQTPAAPAPPQTAMEKRLALIWEKIFQRQGINQLDDFFSLGGDSLSAAVLAAEIYAACGLELHLHVFTEYSTLRDLASLLESRLGLEINSSRPLLPQRRDQPLPTSFVQERTWRFSQTEESSAGYIAAFSHRLQGPLDVSALHESMNALNRRHEILRTNFAEIDDQVFQIIHSPGPVDLPFLDWSGHPDAEERALQFFRQEASRPFHLTWDNLQRFYLIRLRPEEHWLLRVGHHIISDGWSWDVYFRELAQLYEAHRFAQPLPPPDEESLQYADYAAWERQILSPRETAYQDDLAWWKEQFSGHLPPLEFSFRRPAPLSGVDYTEGFVRWETPVHVAQGLEELARDENVTFFIVRLAAVAALLAETTAPADVVLGLYINNRKRVELQNMFGFFANLVTLRLRCDSRQTFRHWLTVAREKVLETERHGTIPYEHLCDEMRAQGVVPPEIRMIFASAQAQKPVRLGEVEMTLLDRKIESMPWGFNLRLDQREGIGNCLLAFDAGLYHPEGARAWTDRLNRLLEAVASSPDRLIADLLASLGPPAVDSQSPKP